MLPVTESLASEVIYYLSHQMSQAVVNVLGYPSGFDRSSGKSSKELEKGSVCNQNTLHTFLVDYKAVSWNKPFLLLAVNHSVYYNTGEQGQKSLGQWRKNWATCVGVVLSAGPQMVTFRHQGYDSDGWESLRFMIRKANIKSFFFFKS